MLFLSKEKDGRSEVNIVINHISALSTLYLFSLLFIMLLNSPYTGKYELYDIDKFLINSNDP